MTKQARVGAVEIALLAAIAGCEPVDDGAARPGSVLDQLLPTDHVLEGDRPVFVDTAETMTVADGCAKTRIDAHRVLRENCAECHDRGMASQGVPRFDFVMDDARLKTTTWTRLGSVLRFLVPGDPDNSMIYVRAAIIRDMPPVIERSIPVPSNTFSDSSVLRAWIENCM